MSSAKSLDSFPRPNVAVDIAVLTVVDAAADPRVDLGRLSVLVLRSGEQTPGVLPGRFIRERRTIDETIREILELKLDLDPGDISPTLLKVFDDPHRGFVHLTGLNGPAHATASGKVLLAYRPALAGRYGTDIPLPAFTPRTITTAAGFAAELARVRQAGIAFNNEEHVPGAIGVAGPVLGPRRMPIAAMAVGGSRSHLDLAGAAALIRRTCESASERLAHAWRTAPAPRE